MIKIKSIKYNFFMNFMLTASNFIFPLITFPYISRILLADGTGKIAFVSSVAGYFLMFASLGIPTYGIRACAKVRDDKEKLSKATHEILIIHTMTTFLSVVAFLISIFLIKEFYVEKTLMVINALSIVLNVLGANWLYSALEQYSYITWRSLAFKVISIILMFIFVHEKSDYIIYGAITILASMGANILNFINLKKYIYFKKYDNYELKLHMRPIMVFFAQSVAITIYTNLDTVMLGFISGNVEVGYYNAAIKVKSILLSLVTSLGVVLLPRLSYYLQKDLREEFYSLIKKALSIVFIISIPLCVYFILYSYQSLVFLSGDNFVGATLAMQIITPTIFFIGLTNVLGIQILTPMGKEKYVVYSVIIGAIIDLILNIIFIPKLGAAGASLGTLFAEVGVLIVQIYFTWKIVSPFFKEYKYYKIIGAVLSAAFASFIIGHFSYSSLFIELLFTGITFFGVYVGILIFLREDLVDEYFYKLIQFIKKKKY